MIKATKTLTFAVCALAVACSAESSVIAVEPVWWPANELAGVQEAVQAWQYAGCPLVLTDHAPHAQLMLVDRIPPVVADRQLTPVAAGQVLWWGDRFVVYVLRAPPVECSISMAEVRRRVLLHELGHVCGLDDVVDPTSVMHWRLTDGECISSRVPALKSP